MPSDLGYNYYHGIGTSLNYEEAFRLYLFAAENGSKVGAYDVGISYYNGNGTPQNYAEAFRWFEAAARDEYALAYTFLGDMYKDGLGVTKNEAMALDRYIEGAYHAKRIPHVGQVIEADGCRVTILKRRRRRVSLVRLEVVEFPEAESDEDILAETDEAVKKTEERS